MLFILLTALAVPRVGDGPAVVEVQEAAEDQAEEADTAAVPAVTATTAAVPHPAAI